MVSKINQIRKSQRSELRAGYLIRNPIANLIVRLIDDALKRTVRIRNIWNVRTITNEGSVNRVLIANGAHLGDVVMTTAILPVLRAAYPDVKIGLLIGSWSIQVVEGHPLVDTIHIVDHWALNRRERNFLIKVARYLRTRHQALEEIRKIGYDVAIDLYQYFPNAIGTLYAARIPKRIGYSSAGFGPLLTRSVDWRCLNKSIQLYHLDLLKAIPGFPAISDEVCYPNLPQGETSLKRYMLPRDYVVLHMGAGATFKEWPVASWRALIRELAAQGRELVFCGHGQRDAAILEELSDDALLGRNLCNRLNWSEYVQVISGASAVVSVDTVAAHVASAVQTKALVLGTGIVDRELWKPVYSLSVKLVSEVPCSPCYLKTGCAAMQCVKGLEVSEVQAAFTALYSAQ